MIEYLFTGLCVTVVMAAGYLLLDPSSAQQRLRLCLFALIFMVLPWAQLLPSTPPLIQLPSFELVKYPEQVLSVAQASLTGVLRKTGVLQESSVIPQDILLVMFGAGLFAFVLLVIVYHHNIMRWRRLASLQVHSQGYKVWVLPASSVVASSGLWNKEIWVGDQVFGSSQRAVAILHEREHFDAHHHWLRWLTVVCLCMFWWHPLVWLWSALIWRELELDCDERCALKMPPDIYRRELAQVAINVARPILALGMATRHSFTVTRLRRLESLSRMKPWHAVVVPGVIFASTVGIWSGLWSIQAQATTAQPSAVSAQTNTKDRTQSSAQESQIQDWQSDVIVNRPRSAIRTLRHGPRKEYSTGRDSQDQHGVLLRYVLQELQGEEGVKVEAIKIEMGTLIAFGETASVGWLDRRLQMKAQRIDDGSSVSVVLYEMSDPQRPQMIGVHTAQIAFGQTEQALWSLDERSFELAITPTLQLLPVQNSPVSD